MSFYKINCSLPSFLCVILTGCVLISCSSNQPSKRIKVSEQITNIHQVQSSILSASQLIQNAQDLPVEQASIELISASEQLLIEQQYHQAIWLAHQLLTFIEEPDKKIQLQLIKLQGLTSLQQVETATEVYNLIEELQHKYSIEPSLRYLTLKQELLILRDDIISSVDAQLHAFAKNNNVTDNDVNFIWQRLSHLSNWQIEQLAMRNPPFFKGWQQLINFAFKFGDNNDTFQRYLTQWQRSYPTHPGNIIVQQLQTTLINSQINKLENIAIILPLTGKQELAGKVAQQGILAAFNNDSEKTLHFIDAEQLDMAQLPQQLTELNVDYVIGPLLRENVDAYLALEELTIPTLLLNIPSELTLKAHQVAFSMRPEDEAIQAATTLSNKQFKHPLVLSHRDNVSQRITQTFLNTWQKITSTTPDVVYFDRDKNMQKVLKTSLGIDNSETRINRIKSRIKQKLGSEPRNRRDIDMIYVVGSVSETRLLKPFIDVNISPFAKRIPVYASSRSHSAQSDASDSRDLAGLIFTEMPWLLSSSQQNTSLHQLSHKLWPNRSDGLERIFAMGYDSLSLIDKIFAMQQHPYVRHFGQTGILQLNTNNILSRSLLWGKYQNDKAEEIAMDR
ncbi:penicillin-binding protein activator [Thalassotalea profundi]|uniref:Penicillin-binding protein activator n=1 Tax=Thalassotalea profundi TaxID=2036687 RepID=A0ABQ3IKQ4_9GAMM|nr:penicillin-binding protein activator [Thalassotalea profundi]GHE81919.1 penicillin-binding protein activator [Thalassotalea profundi]